MLYLFLELSVEQIEHKISFNKNLIKKLRKRAVRNTELYLLTGERTYLNAVCECDRIIAELEEELLTLSN